MQKLALSLTLFLTTLIAPAQAQNTRSWVASFGSDLVNNCTRPSPCATFAFAVGLTNAGGVINCVDQGDFGGPEVFIDKSITIDCEGVQGHLGHPGAVQAIRVLAGPADVVVVRGLDIDGNGGEIGIRLITGAALHIEKCVIRNFSSSGSGWGIIAQPGGNLISELFVSDTVLENNGSSSSGGGILIEPNISNGITRVTLNHVEARNNFFGIKADGATGAKSGGVINMTVRDSVSSGNASNGIVATGNTSGPAIIMMVEHSTSSQNATAGFGIISDGPKSTITLTGSTVMGNINGIGASNGGSLVSFHDNKVILNSTNGTPTSVASPE